ncbi:hypothetical protein BpHYR1_024281 [Brachionus plicatilis]|uniref:Uncharacterized protein n=1 Tax=Brachionus plicatilis TaxID=10195 RepID=A0A3M7RD42_BRAPC|nr:hypothetical protein BpHYR1_024281 [Brachionus plicatilis]
METTIKEAIKSHSYSSGVASGYNSSSVNFVSPNKARMADFQDLGENYKSNLVHDEKFAQEILSKAGPSITYQRKNHSHEIGLNSNGYQANSSNLDRMASLTSKLISESNSGINLDEDPIIITKPNSQNVVYKQQVNIRYLQPPTPPPPAPIIIREKQLSPPPRQPPIIIRQTAPAAPTPPPLTIRERAPTPPADLEPQVIERSVQAQPPPPRQVIIERVPAPPTKPRPIIYEKWLPYKNVERPVIIQKIKHVQQQPPPKNVIIEYETPKAVAVRQVIEEGIFKVDPTTYEKNPISNGEVRIVDRITDLPIENSRILAQLKLESASKTYERPDEIYSEFLNATTGFQSNNDNVEYETLTATVPESLAEKLLSDARAAGALKPYRPKK